MVQNGNDTIKSFKMAWGFSKHGVLPTEPGLLIQIYFGFNIAFPNLTSMYWRPKISLALGQRKIEGPGYKGQTDLNFPFDSLST